jgi:hypothetical protein
MIQRFLRLLDFGPQFRLYVWMERQDVDYSVQRRGRGVRSRVDNHSGTHRKSMPGRPGEVKLTKFAPQVRRP